MSAYRHAPAVDAMSNEPQTPELLQTDCCIAGGGPAGMVLGVLLAQAGIKVVVLEKHADFLRDFRGDTVHPSTLQILADMGLLERFNRLPQRREPRLQLQFADGLLTVADFRGLGAFPYIAFVPQWDFLDLLADEGRRFPGFQLRMSAEAAGLHKEAGRVTGVVAQGKEGPINVAARVVVAADGRASTFREQAGLAPRSLGAPMDVLWFSLPRLSRDPDHSFGVAGRGQLVAMIHRNDYWQIGYIVPKGSAEELRRQPIADFHRRVGHAAPLLAERAETLCWDDVHLLTVKVDRLERWYMPGLLFIGDAAHAMSPVGGVGINLAVQDAVAAANALVPALRAPGPVPDTVLAAVQRRRLWPTRVIQFVQVQAQRRIVAPALRAAGGQPRIPPLLRILLGFRFIRRIPARLFGHGIRRERPEFGP